MTPATPPEWADVLLRLVLSPADRETVSGDLLEDYRDRILPARGVTRANLWYVRQVLGFTWRSCGVWAVLLGGSFVARDLLDWFSPTTNFHMRSIVSTFSGISIFVLAGFVTSWRTRLAERPTSSAGALEQGIEVAVAGLSAGVITAIAAAAISVTSLVLLLLFRHDAATFEAIEASGGFEEAILFPVFLVFPGAVFALTGGTLAAIGRGVFFRRSA